MAELSLTEAIGIDSSNMILRMEANDQEVPDHISLRQQYFEELFDIAIQRLNDTEDDHGLCMTDEFKLGQIILRRASVDNSKSIQRLLSKTKPTNENAENSTLYNDVARVLWGCQSVVVLIVRAVATYDEPPLGFAILTLGLSTSQGRAFRLSQIAHEEHFPRERFDEILDKLGEKFEIQIDGEKERLKTQNNDTAGTNYMDSKTQQKPNFIDIQSVRALHSVKEEEDEDDENEKTNEDHNCYKRLKLH